MRQPKPFPAALLLLAPLLIAAVAAPLPPDRESEHVVKAGETLSGVAQRAEVPRILIVEANHLTSPFALRSGQKLTIPRTRHHTVGVGDTRFTIAFLYGVLWQDIAVASGVDPAAALKQGQRLLIPSVIAAPPVTAAPTGTQQSATVAPDLHFLWPMVGDVRRGFTHRGSTANYHDGLDLTAPDGTAVRASAAGKVLFAGDEPRQFGKLVVVDHGGGMQSAYAFLSRITVKEGDAVTQGERLGLSGHSGQARGPELHFEIRRNNRPTDPATQLPPRRLIS
jgi:murein DD-endopeptidase MepM/ murein hydrolase activator NlpD